MDGGGVHHLPAAHRAFGLRGRPAWPPGPLRWPGKQLSMMVSGRARPGRFPRRSGLARCSGRRRYGSDGCRRAPLRIIAPEAGWRDRRAHRKRPRLACRRTGRRPVPSGGAGRSQPGREQGEANHRVKHASSPSPIFLSWPETACVFEVSRILIAVRKTFAKLKKGTTFFPNEKPAFRKRAMAERGCAVRPGRRMSGADKACPCVRAGQGRRHDRALPPCR